MAQSNKRYFNTFFYEDPYVEDLDMETKWLYATLILNPHNNLAGVYEISLNKLSAYTGIPLDKVRQSIQKLQEDRKILFSGNWLALKNFIKNNELNPNMCKNSFDIMVSAPKDKMVFIVADSAGNAEPWLESFVEKVGKGVNTAIDYKNKNIKKKALENHTEPILIKNVDFTMETFINEIMKTKKELIKGTIGEPFPNPSLKLGKPLREPRGEYEYKIEVELEGEVESEIEVEMNNTLQPTAQKPKSLYKIIESIFLSKNNYNFDNYKKEGMAIKGIITKAEKRDNSEKFIQELIEKFYDLTVNGNDFWTGQPFLPSALNASGIFARVEKQIQVEVFIPTMP